ncbi:MAG: ABC transporter ATP-binding protein [Chloroflexi bacterium]|nr:ABC transporter ATP-binding protein [Chloroflexota bacterium]
MAGEAVRTEQLTKSYGEQRGVFDLDLEVCQGEIFGFLGPNGAGKTTTIRLLLDLIRPLSGRAEVFGHDCRKEATEVHRLTGYLPGEFALDARLSGRQLLTYLGNLRGGIDRGYTEGIVRRLELDLDRPFGQYSRGNKQKVGLVQAFMHRPPLLILDEPTSGLDPLNQETVLDLVREARAAGATVFFSSHMLAEVEATCDRVAFIRDGRLVRVGPVHDVVGAKGHRIEAECALPVDGAAFGALSRVSQVEANGTSVRFLVQGDMREALALLARFEPVELESREPSLAEVFVGLYESHEGN